MNILFKYRYVYNEKERRKMNRTDKPKMTSKALVDKLRDEKGVSFKYVTEDNAEKYLGAVALRIGAQLPFFAKKELSALESY